MAEAFATSVGSNLVSKLGEYLFAPIGRQFGYVLCYKSYLQDLKNGVEKLEISTERVQHSVHEAENNGKRIENDIQKWLESVENEATEARNLLKHGESAKNACFCGWLPNPMVRHPIGRKVKKMTQVIKELQDESTTNIFQKVFYEDTLICSVTAPASSARFVDKKEDVLESRASITEDVMKAIADNKVCVIGVYGPGGVGKSKLLEDIERRVKEEMLFDVVATANVSRNPDLKRIQGEIAYALGLKLMNDEPTRGRADRLHKRLERDSQKNILIILDNLWEKLELKDIGIPCGYDNKVRGCKLLLTSRYRNVLRNDMVSDREFGLNELKHEEARALFEWTMGDGVKDPEFEPLIDGVVKNCGGLPLLIVSLAKKLKHGDLAAWRNASTNIEGSDIKSIVELNYNDLKDERIRSLFLICAINSGNIMMRDSVVYCLGLGLFKRFKTIENARDRLIMDVHSLQDSSLLLDSDDMEELKMHDIFVDVAISIASTQWNALVGREDYGFKEWSKDELRKCTAISFPHVGIDELPGRLDCPNLMLLLLEDNLSLEIPESFFESMEKLQVLDLTGFSFTSLPSSIEFLENLESLCLDQCFLEDVTVLGKLKGLQFLSFFNSLIIRLPKEIGELTKLRFLDLRGCVKLEVIEPGMLGNLVNLEELYMEDSFDQWEAEDEAPRSNASLAELKNMKKLSTLYIAIPYSAKLSRDLPFGKLNKYKIQIGDVWDWSDEYKESRTLKLKLDSGNLLFKEWVLECLQKTQDLHLEGLQDGINSFHDLHVEGFRELKHFHVQNNSSFHYVVCSTENIHCTAFTRLESLFLENLSNLEKICHGHLAPESFINLKIVKVDSCSKIKHLFLKRIISQLEEIEISTCHLMQRIVADIEGDADGDEIDDDTEEKSCNLRRLTLQNLPEMMSFCKTADHSINFFDSQQLIKLQSLEAITIEGCQLIQEVFDLDGLTSYGQVEILSRLRELTLSDLPSLGCIWNNDPRRILCFRNLRTLKVQNCENLRFLFSSSMAKALGQIKEIKIVNCKLMEEIIDVQEEELEEATTNDTLEFPLLTSLSLEELPNLTTFSYGKGIHCPSLTELVISKCPKMMTFSSFKGKQHSMRADDSDLSLPSFFNEKVLFPSLEELKLSSMCQLKRIWHNQLHGQSFCKLASLTIEFCENLSHIFTSKSVDRLQSINKIEVVGCPSLEALCEPVQFLSESMKILHGDDKEKIWRDDLASNAFGKLKTLVVENCEKLSSIFSSYTMFTRFQNVEKITVTDCGSLEVVFHFQGSKIGEAHSTSTFQLRELVLTRLPKMKHVWSGLSQGCLTFGHLQYMEANECESLKSLVPSSVAKSMTQLEKLLVNDCRVEDIIMEEDGVGMNVGDVFFPQLTNLELTELPELRSFYRNSHTSSWPFLKKLEVKHCSKMRSFSFSCDIQSCQDTTTNEKRPAFFSFEKVIPHLEQLTLMREDVVMMIPQNYIFRNLKELDLGCYHDENVAFPSDFLLQRFPNLEELNVVCSSFEEIFSEDAFGQGGAIPFGRLIDLEEPLKALVNLKRLWLIDLCNLRRVWKDGSLMAEILNQIEVMSIVECPSLSTIFSYPTSLQSLTELCIWDCAGLVHMGTCTAMTSLVHLTEVYLKDCGAMENVVIDDGNGVEKISFPKLESLILEGLPNLESFSPTNCTFMFPSLMYHVVNQCPKMNMFSKGALRTPKLFMVLLSTKDDEGCWKGDLNTTIQTLSTSCDPY